MESQAQILVKCQLGQVIIVAVKILRTCRIIQIMKQHYKQPIYKMLALKISSHVLIFRVMEIRALEVRQVECHPRKVLMDTTKMNKIWIRNMDGIKTTKICPYHRPHQNQ